jgi:hypothetical protein
VDLDVFEIVNRSGPTTSREQHILNPGLSEQAAMLATQQAEKAALIEEN